MEKQINFPRNSSINLTAMDLTVTFFSSQSSQSSQSKTYSPIRTSTNSCKKRNNLKKEAKFCLYSIVLLCAISLQTANAIPIQAAGQRLNLHTQEYRERRYQQLLKEQRSIVVPTPHKHHLHHRSVVNMPQMGSKKDDANPNDYCRAIEKVQDTIKSAIEQASATFLHFYTILDKYTKAKHNDTLQGFYEKWSKHSLQLKHPYAQFLNRDINVQPNFNKQPEHLIHQELTEETLTTEFLNINQTLRTLELVYDERDKERKDARHRFDLRRENESDTEFRDRLRIIDKTYDDLLMNLRQDLHHIGEVLEKLNIQPQSDFDVSYNRDAQQIEWLLFHEHFSFMKYLVETYTFLLKQCNTASS